MILPLLIGVVVGYMAHNIIHRYTKQIGRKMRHKIAAAQTKRWAGRK